MYCRYREYRKKIEYKELVSIINSFLAELSQEKRNIFVCRYWYSDSVASIAKKYGRRENAVSMTLNRLKAGIKAYLLERAFRVFGKPFHNI